MLGHFLLLLEKLSPLFLFLVAGFIAARFLKVTRESIAKLLIYVISPIVFFETLIRSPFNPKLIVLPFFYASICSILGIATYKLSKKFFRSPMRNLFSYAAGSANTGYFGIPATAILLGEERISTAIFIIIGYNLYEYTTGFYLAARGSFDTRESLKKIASLPSLWTFLFSLVVSAMGFHHIPPSIEPILTSFRGAYSCLGLMMIGLGLGSIRTLRLHYKFISCTLLIKLLAFPALVVSVIFLDHATIQFLDYSLVEILLLMSLVPLAANGVSIATELKLPTDEMAFTITLSTAIALLWIPLSWATWVPWVLNSVR
ncbi:MAG: AEC family transporter [Bdellovibrionota bacterium]